MTGITLGLDRISLLLEAIGNPQNNFKSIHITGSNGKGSTGNYITHLLDNAAHFSSPHLKYQHDSIKINRKSVSHDTFSSVLHYVTQINSKNLIKCSNFEILTAVAFKIFANEQVQLAIIEVGLGGLTDATNCLPPPLICVFTPISMEHTEFLGNTIQEIAENKSGIIKKGVQAAVVAYQPYKEALEVIKAKADNCNATLFCVDINQDSPGEGYQRENIATALKVIEVLNKYVISSFSSPNPDVDKLLKLKYPGRLDHKKYKERSILIDGCHNLSGASKFSEYVCQKYSSKKIVWVFACSSTKNGNEILQALIKNKTDDIVIPTIFKTPDGMQWVVPKPPSEISKICHEIGVKCVDGEILGIFEALDIAVSYSNDFQIVVCGSLYLVSEIYKLLYP